MKAAFIESQEFSAWVSGYLADETLSALQQELMKDPAKGAVMSGCGGLRKVRVADVRRGQGKRGGARVIYLRARSQAILPD
jgi:putative transcriptional regulator